MAIKISGNTVISDSFVLERIVDMDAQTETTTNNAIKNQNNVLRIYDSAGVEVRTFFCAKT